MTGVEGAARLKTIIASFDELLPDARMHMKKLCFIIGSSVLLFMCGCATTDPQTSSGRKMVEPMVVEAGCGQCLLGLKDKKGCDLAVRRDGHSYFVDGFTMKQLGDAHADDGMCNAVRKAKVSGEIINGRFAASSFELLPARE